MSVDTSTSSWKHQNKAIFLDASVSLQFVSEDEKVSHLVAPLPLERHGDFKENGYDPREVNIANNLEKNKQTPFQQP